MNRWLKNLKLELFQFRQAFFKFKKGFSYIYHKYFLAQKILKLKSPIQKPVNHSDYSIHVLVCHKDFIAMLWSLASFYSYSSIYGELYIHDDGSLTSVDKKYIKKLFPWAILINAQKFPSQFSQQLNAHPLLKKFRITYNYFSFKKIIDPYFVSSKKIHLIFDTDILWFKKPNQLEEEIKSGASNSIMQRNSTSGLTKNDLLRQQQLTRYNAGIILYSLNNFDLDKFKKFLQNMDTRDWRNLHFADQTGHVRCLKNLIGLPEEIYKISGPVNSKTIIRHYTSPRRSLFYAEGIKILKNKIFK